MILVSLFLDGYLLDVVWDFRHLMLWFWRTSVLLIILTCQIDHDLVCWSFFIITFSRPLISASSPVPFLMLHICSRWINGIIDSMTSVSHCLKSVRLFLIFYSLNTSSARRTKIIPVCIVGLVFVSIEIDLRSLHWRFSSFYKLLLKLAWVWWIVTTILMCHDQLLLFEVTDGIWRSRLKLR